MFEELKELFASLGFDEDMVTPDADIISDLGADSLDVLQMTMELEDRYGIQIEEEDLLRFHTVQDVLDYIEEKMPED